MVKKRAVDRKVLILTITVVIVALLAFNMAKRTSTNKVSSEAKKVSYNETFNLKKGSSAILPNNIEITLESIQNAHLTIDNREKYQLVAFIKVKMLNGGTYTINLRPESGYRQVKLISGIRDDPNSRQILKLEDINDFEVTLKVSKEEVSPQDLR